MRQLGAVLFVFLLSGCGSFEGTIFKSKAKKENDFLRTEIIANGSALADGVSELVVGIQLKNSDLSIVKDFKPTYEIVAGAGVMAGECTYSLPNGMSYCLLKATQPGVKRLRLSNARVGLERDVTFDPVPRTGLTWGHGSSAQPLGTTADGYKIESSSGAMTSDASLSASGGYKVFFGVQGAVSSR